MTKAEDLARIDQRHADIRKRLERPWLDQRAIARTVVPIVAGSMLMGAALFAAGGLCMLAVSH